jgi:hypothetical protein
MLLFMNTPEKNGFIERLNTCFWENLFNPKKVWDLGAQGGWPQELAHTSFVGLTACFH